MSLFEWVFVFGLMVTAWLGSLALLFRGLRTIRARKEYEAGAKRPYGFAQVVIGAVGIVLWGSITVASVWSRFQQ